MTTQTRKPIEIIKTPLVETDKCREVNGRGDEIHIYEKFLRISVDCTAVKDNEEMNIPEEIHYVGEIDFQRNDNIVLSLRQATDKSENKVWKFTIYSTYDYTIEFEDFEQAKTVKDKVLNWLLS